MTGFAAVDLGASSGRVMAAQVENNQIRLREVHRFPNRPARVGGTLHWDVLALWNGVLDGLAKADHVTHLSGIGVDSWAIDYGLLDRSGTLIGNPVHYRDTRTDGLADAVARVIPPEEMFATTGVQLLPFNTVYQWVAARETPAMRTAASALMIPDLFNYWLTGEQAAEVTNASTTGLLDVRSRAWATDLMFRLGLRHDLMPDPVEPGTLIGKLGRIQSQRELGAIPVYAVGSHDTASAVAAVPTRDERFAFISSGTWSLVGVEVCEPNTTAAARSAGFGNELGVDGTIRFLRNVMGLWLLQECLRAWEQDGHAPNLRLLLAEASALPARQSIIDPDLPVFLPPGDMPARIAAECRRTGVRVPTSQAEFTRCILDSLAEAYGRAVRAAVELTGHDVDRIHVVGGGAQNDLLCQLTADACDRVVEAGPVEAAAYGNVLLQARASGTVAGNLADLRAIVAKVGTRTYRPRS